MSDAAFRPEIVQIPRGTQDFGIIEKPLTPFERLYNQGWLRKTGLIVLLALGWELYARHLDNELLVPTFSATVTAWWAGVSSGVIPDRSLASLQVLAIGFTAGVVLAGILTVLAITTRIGTDFLETMTAMLNPLPAIALLIVVRLENHVCLLVAIATKAPGRLPASDILHGRPRR